MSRLLLVPLEDAVVFPTMTLTLTVDVGDEDRVLLVPRHESAFAGVGTVADVSDRVRLPGGGHAVMLSGLHRGVAGAATTAPDGKLYVEVEDHPDDVPVDGRTRDLEREYRAVVEELLELRGDDGRIAAFVRAITEPGTLADTAGYSPDLTFAQKVGLLETLDVTTRLELSLSLQRERLAELQVRQRIRDDVQSGADKQQREYFLRKQMESIQKELGEDDASVVDEYRTQIAEAGMPGAVREQAEKELGRLERMGEQSGEASMIRTYLDWLIAVPWSKRSEERLDPVHAREVLDADHAGLEDVKERITEYIAVRKLREDRGIEVDRKSGAILTLIGPPGHRQDVDRRVDRPCDRARVRAHVARRRARRGRDPRPPAHVHRRAAWPPRARPARRRDDEPGDHARRGRQGRRRLARGPERGIARGARPGAEPLVPGSLLGCRARPLRRAVPRDRERRGHDPRPAAGPHGGHPLRRLHDRGEGRDRPRLPVAASAGAQRPAARGGRGRGRAAGDDREGVHPRGGRAPARARARDGAAQDRDADRIGRKLTGSRLRHPWRAGARRPGRGARRARAPEALPGGRDPHGDAGRRDRPGRDRRRRRRAVRGGRADARQGRWQGRARAHRPARRRDEGVGADRPLLRARARRGDRDRPGGAGRFHVHVPAGAIPKDGPSAGVTMVTALSSLLSGRPVKHTVGMTGEVTLQGRVLPIGGVKQKVLAAHAAGLTDVILPERNRGDLDEVPAEVREQMTFHLAMTVDEVLAIALEPERVSATH